MILVSRVSGAVPWAWQALKRYSHNQQRRPAHGRRSA